MVFYFMFPYNRFNCESANTILSQSISNKWKYNLNHCPLYFRRCVVLLSLETFHWNNIKYRKNTVRSAEVVNSFDIKIVIIKNNNFYPLLPERNFFDTLSQLKSPLLRLSSTNETNNFKLYDFVL